MKLQADGGDIAAVGGDHLPVELDRVGEASALSRARK
jgi:hypothetical protein